MSQNQKPENIDGVISGLVGDDREDVARVVERLRPQ
jgi:hypothetical protein